MRRLLQFGTLMLLAAIFMPVQEAFDVWDDPGLWNDTEFSAFAFAATICLVLLVCYLIAAGILKILIIAHQAVRDTESAHHGEPGYTFIFEVPPLLLLPLRI